MLHSYVGAYVLVHIVWPYAAYDRFLMPLLPWFLLFLLTEITLLVSSSRREFTSGSGFSKKLSASLVSVVVVLMTVLIVYNISAGIRMLKYSQKDRTKHLEDESAIAWLKDNSDPSDVVIAYRDPTYYLYTNRKSIRSISAREGGLTQESTDTPDQQVKVIFRIADESNARFLVVTATDFDQEDEPELRRASLNDLLAQNSGKFVQVFDSMDGRARVYRIEHTT